VLLGGDVAEHGGAGTGGFGGADGAGDMVVAREDVGDDRAEHVEGGVVAEAAVGLHVEGDFVERDVAGAFDHDLDQST